MLNGGVLSETYLIAYTCRLCCKLLRVSISQFRNEGFVDAEGQGEKCSYLCTCWHQIRTLLRSNLTNFSNVFRTLTDRWVYRHLPITLIIKRKHRVLRSGSKKGILICITVYWPKSWVTLMEFGSTANVKVISPLEKVFITWVTLIFGPSELKSSLLSVTIEPFLKRTNTYWDTGLSGILNIRSHAPFLHLTWISEFPCAWSF